MMNLIEEYGLPYRYTGDGSFWIDNVNPDFVNTNGCKICIEVWGDYWHSLDEEQEKDCKRLETIGSFGWQRIVVWAHELDEMPGPEIVMRIRQEEMHYAS